MLLEACGISAAPTELAHSAEEAIAAAKKMGFPVVMKANGAAILHKSDAGGVVLDLESSADVRATFDDLRSRFGDQLDGVVVQKMVPGKVEMVVGATLESTFGHVIAYGTGGTMVELMDDVSFRLHPITDLNIEDMLAQVRGTRLIRGFRGSPPLDEKAVREVLERVSQMIELVPEIHEMDINPLKVLENGAVAVDWRIRVAKTIVRRSRRINY